VPFTPAHAAAALPFRRLHLVWSALIIGTFAPDLEYFVRLSPDDGYGHTLVGSLALSLPLAIVTLWLFHKFVKGPLIDLFPRGIEQRLTVSRGEFPFGGAVRFAWIIASIVVGMSTHLLWDSFTHPNTWLYRRWPLLRAQPRMPLFGTAHVYKALQHASTATGLVILLIWLVLWYRDAKISTVYDATPAARKFSICAVIAAIALLVAGVRALGSTGMPLNHIAAKRFVGLFVVTLIAAMWWEFVLYGIWRTRLQAPADDSPFRAR
jgi:Domain of unknown function (DUF4184)